MGPNPKLTGENGRLLFQLKVMEAVDALQSKKQTSSNQPLFGVDWQLILNNLNDEWLVCSTTCVGIEH